MFQFFKPPFSTKITYFTKFAVLEPKFTHNFRSKALNFAKIQFFKPYFFPKIQFFKPCFFPKNQFFKPLFLVPTRCLSPHLRPFGLHTYTKMKVEYPPGVFAGELMGQYESPLFGSKSPLKLILVIIPACNIGTDSKY